MQKSLCGLKKSKTLTVVGKKIYNNDNNDNNDGFTLNITSDPACTNFHKAVFYKPIKLYKVNYLFDNIKYFTYGSISSTRQRGKFYIPSDVKTKVAVISFNRNLLNLSNDLLFYSNNFIKTTKIHIDQVKLELYTKRNYDVAIAICEQTLLLSYRLGNLIYAANNIASHVLLIILSSNNIDELATDKNIKIVYTRANKVPLIMEIYSKPTNQQQRFIMNALIQYTTFFNLKQDIVEKYYQQIKNKK